MNYIPPVFNDKPAIIITQEAPWTEKTNTATVEYSVVAGDTLEKIASEQHTTVSRLFSKNTSIVDPNVIEVGQKLVIPAEDEVLTERAIIDTEPLSRNYSSPSGGFSVSGGYTAGYCTAYAWSRRPDLPGNLGNADTWGMRAAAQGYTVNNTPSAGAIGVTKAYMHVVYIERVNGDGTVFLSEQNYRGWGVVSTRTAPISEFTYIH